MVGRLKPLSRAKRHWLRRHPPPEQPPEGMMIGARGQLVHINMIHDRAIRDMQWWERLPLAAKKAFISQHALPGDHPYLEQPEKRQAAPRKTRRKKETGHD